MTMPGTIAAAAGETETVYIGVPQTAELLGIHPHTVRVLIKTGRLPALRAGRRFRIKRSDIAAALVA
jgi:excisionase family DNA binding protein